MLSRQEAVLSSALILFAQSNQRSVLAWNALLRDYARHGEQGLMVLHLFHKMHQEGVLPNRVSYILALSSLPAHPSLASSGKYLHASIQACNFRSHVIVGTSIFNMYARCCSLRAAVDVFHDMPTRDAVSWNAILALHSNRNLCEEALHIFARLLDEHPSFPNHGTYASVLGACANQARVLPGRLVHNCILENMRDIDVTTATCLVNLYGKCDCMEDAEVIFAAMPERNVISWNTLIFQFTQQNQSQRSLEHYQQMQIEGILPDDVTLAGLFAACGSDKNLAEGEHLLASVLGSGSNLRVVMGNSVLNMYGKCNSLERAQAVLNVMEEQDVITWTTIITAFSRNDRCKSALEYFHEMLEAGINPNYVTFIGILDACASLGDFEHGNVIHAHIIEYGFEGEKAIRNSLISMYGKCYSPQDALETFHKTADPDVVTWNSVIAVYIFQRDSSKALQLFNELLNGLVSPNLFTYVSIVDVCSNFLTEGQHVHALVIEDGYETETIVGTALINMYSDCGMVEDAQKSYDAIREQNVISWTAIITAYARHKQGGQAIQLFDQMQAKGFKPSNVTLAGILASFSASEALEEAEQMCHRIVNCGLDTNVMVGNTIVTLYGRCGNVGCARMAFDRMQERDLISWNSMLGVYAQHGNMEEVSVFLEQMIWEGLTPDQVTMLTVIHACSEQLTLRRGKQFHCYVMELGYMKDTMIGTALMRFYGKCGSLNDGLLVFNNLSNHDVVSWTVVLIACAQNGRAKEAMQLFHQMQQEGVTPNEVTFSNLINSCNHAGLFHDGLLCFNSMVGTHNIAPEVDHYVSMIDLLGRAGQIHQADSLISEMPFQPTSIPYVSLLGACRQPLDAWQGEQAADKAMELDSEVCAPYVLLSNIHSVLPS